MRFVELFLAVSLGTRIKASKAHATFKVILSLKHTKEKSQINIGSSNIHTKATNELIGKCGAYNNKTNAPLGMRSNRYAFLNVQTSKKFCVQNA